MSCSFCGAESAAPVAVAPKEDTVLLCATCRDGIENGAEDAPRWQCLNDAIWSEDAAVKVLAYRMLKSLQSPWANDVLDIAYLSEEERDWAEALPDPTPKGTGHRDANGALLAQGTTWC